MAQVSTYFINFTFFVILYNPTLILGASLCTHFPFNSACVFSGVVTNETHIHFQPNSSTDPEEENSIFFVNSSIYVLTDESCDAFPNLRDLEVRSSSLQLIQNDALNHCAKLIRFDISQNNVKQVDPILFKSTPNLEYVGFAANKFTYIDAKLFEPTKNLRFLWLNDNFLVHFDFRRLPKLDKLENVYINSNNLLDLDEDAVVTNLPKVDYVGIGDNLLECQSLEAIMKVFKAANITSGGFYNERSQNRGKFYSTTMFEGIECLTRSEHLKATADNFVTIQEGQCEKSAVLNSTIGEPNDGSQYQIIVVQVVSSALILFCIAILTWHGFYWNRTVNGLFDDNGEYYYCNYDFGNQESGNGIQEQQESKN